MKRYLFLLLLLAGWLTQLAVLPGCANIIPPAGGPRDSIAPVLLKASPGDSTRNFTGNRISFTFDEFVEVQNVQENLLVSPLPKVIPQVSSRLNVVTVKLIDSLEPGTTYSFDFGNSIKDFNEGNVLKDFRYVFSTGNQIDSLELSGQVLLAETGRTDSTLIVMLHTKPDDSVVIKEKPRYVTRLDGNGRFRFTNLPPKTYYLYALKDEGGMRRYQDDKQLFAFADSAILLRAGYPAQTLFAYSVKPPAPATTPPATGLGGRIRGVTNEGAEKRLRYRTNLVNNQQDLLSDLVLSVETPLRAFDSSGLLLYTDSAFNPVPGAVFRADSQFLQFTLRNDWKENTLYHLVLRKSWGEDSTGRRLLKDDTLHFQTRKKSEYGQLTLRFRNLETERHPVLLFLNADAVIKSVPLTGPVFSAPLFVPAEYDLRILYDRNRNGRWDPGEFFGKRRQPEIVRPFSRKITVKPNWQNEFDLDVPAEKPSVR